MSNIKNLVPPVSGNAITLNTVNNHITGMSLGATISVPHLSISSTTYNTTGYFTIKNPPPYRKLKLLNIEYTLTKKECPNSFQRWIISTFLGGKWTKKDVAFSLKIYSMLFGATIET